jgi:hypothetical protein
MLVTQRYLEMKHVLAMALEAEVAGLYHAGVHRPDGDLVDFRTLDPIIVGDPDRRSS